MNYRMMRYILAMIMSAEGVFMLLPLAISAFYGEGGMILPFVISIALIAAAVLLLGFKKPENDLIFAREGFIAVAVGWILISVFGALPFYISGAIPSFVDCIFETVSGFTTTGATIINDVEIMPKGLLFWREFTHWIGGMGVLVFLLMLTQISEGHSMYLMRAEVPGPSVGKLAPRASSNALILYGIYTALTVIEAVLLMCGGLPAFDAVTTAMGTAGTGGFSVRNAGIAAYGSAYVEFVVTIFMLLFGVNFNLFYLMIYGRIKQVFKSEELRVYLAIIGISSVSIAINVLNYYSNFGESLRKAFFQVVSIITTTGFYGVDFMDWPDFSKAILLVLLLTGACAGSTAGGIKISRLIIGFKIIKSSVTKLVHPHNVTTITFEGKRVDNETSSFIAVYIAAFFAILFGVTFVVMAQGHDYETSFSAVLSCFNNVGPALGMVGHSGNYNIFNDFTKILMSLLMLTGRLEIFPVLILFAPSTWRKK